MNLLQTLKELCLLNGISGDETAVSDYICRRLDGKCDYRVDNLGNVIAFKKGKKSPSKKLLISAHMDEVGLIVTYVNTDGTLKFSTVGGIDSRVLFGRRVRVGEHGILGVIAGKAVHNLSDDERKKAPSESELTIDIGCFSREEAQKLVSLGDSVTFDSDFLQFGDGMIKSKAIDDRAGCAIMLELIDGELEYYTYFSFVVQEEVGLRGATAAAFSVNPDCAIVLESTTAADIPSAENEKRVCEVGKGAVVSYMDRHTIYDKQLYRLAFETAESLGIPCQTKTVIAGGNDAGAISVAHGGVRTIAVSLPCRYLHSPSCVIAKSDLDSVFELTKKLSEQVQNQ
jgi:endoglucanase